MILNKLMFYNTKYWKEITKTNFIISFYKKIIIRNKIKKTKKLKWLITRKHINVIFSNDKQKRIKRNRLKKKNEIKKIKFLKNKQYAHILFKFKKKYKEKKKIKKLIYKKSKLNA